MCPGSLDAIQGALGTVCEAVDAVMSFASDNLIITRRAFVAIRPPGHHCGEVSLELCLWSQLRPIEPNSTGYSLRVLFREQRCSCCCSW